MTVSHDSSTKYSQSNFHWSLVFRFLSFLSFGVYSNRLHFSATTVLLIVLEVQAESRGSGAIIVVCTVVVYEAEQWL